MFVEMVKKVIQKFDWATPVPALALDGNACTCMQIFLLDRCLPHVVIITCSLDAWPGMNWRSICKLNTTTERCTNELIIWCRPTDIQGIMGFRQMSNALLVHSLVLQRSI